MFGIGFFEILVILVIALLVFGPDRVPTMIKEAAAFVRDLRAMVARARNDLGDSVSDLGIDKEDLELLRELRNPKSYLRQQVLNGADLGLDDPELNEAASLNGDAGRKPQSARPAAHRSRSSGSQLSKPESSKPESSHEIADGDSVTTTAAGDEIEPDDAGHGDSDHDDAGHDVPAAVTASAPRFDPDTT